MDFPLTVGVETRCFRQFYHKKTTVNCWLTIRWGNNKVTNAHAKSTLNGVKNRSIQNILTNRLHLKITRKLHRHRQYLIKITTKAKYLKRAVLKRADMVHVILNSPVKLHTFLKASRFSKFNSFARLDRVHKQLCYTSHLHEGSFLLSLLPP